MFGPHKGPPPFLTPPILDEIRQFNLGQAIRGTREGKVSNEFVARYHHLGYA